MIPRTVGESAVSSLTTFNDIDRALRAFAPPARTLGENYNLDRMGDLLAYLDDPQEATSVVHIAGTSGKTSTAYFLRGLLHAAGTRTGLTVSPHITSIAERVQLDGQALNEAELGERLDKFLGRIKASGIPATYFELIIAFAYSLFAETGVRYAVVETGLGGLLDATNMVRRPDKVCIITDIGFDHTEVLGNTLPAIARQKAGIIQTGNHVFVPDQDRAVVDVIIHRAESVRAHVDVVKFGPAEPVDFQQRNWVLAKAAYAYLAERDHLTPAASLTGADPENMRPPGRLETMRISGRDVIIDGAHNEQKLTALRAALRHKAIDSAAVVANLVSAPESKIEAALLALRPLARHLIIPDFTATQDVIRPSVPAHELAGRAHKLGYQSVEVCPDAEEALEVLLRRPEPALVVTGSLYLISRLRQTLAKGTPSEAVTAEPHSSPSPDVNGQG
jgi:dihydrofolate synthase/folylpolyglutamate synthase